MVESASFLNTFTVYYSFQMRRLCLVVGWVSGVNDM